MTELLTFTIDFAFLCKPIWGNASVSPFPLVLTSFGGTAFPQKYLEERRTPAFRVSPQLHHWRRLLFSNPKITIPLK